VELKFDELKLPQEVEDKICRGNAERAFLERET
jgi:predicted TIM-barrel fold metal-dependent hydrolase